MGQRIFWKRFPARRLQSDARGRALQVYKHTTGATLTLRSPVSRNSSFYGRVGWWELAVGGCTWVLRWFYDRRLGAAPLRMATRCLRQHLWTHYTALCQPRASWATIQAVEGIAHVLPTASPVTERPDGIVAPRIGLPTRPLHRLLTGHFAEEVLSREEYDLFLAERDHWLAKGAFFTSPAARGDLGRICQLSVLLHRMRQVMARRMDRRVLDLYNAAYLRQRRAVRSLETKAQEHADGLLKMEPM